MSTVDEQGNSIEPSSSKSSADFMVVGIGASAGGLHALQRFFENMPADSGIAFVIILHLSPKHESNIDSILQRSTRMPVVQVVERVKLQVNHVYVIPPAQLLIMQDGELALTARDNAAKRPLTIDVFFRTLAKAHGERAVCVVLSGMGSDGAVGLTRVKEAGGVTIAQAAGDAEYDSMPTAALATGHVDIVLPVVEMPQRLLELWENAKRIRLPTQDRPETVLPPEDESAEQSAEFALGAILNTLRVRSGHDFKHYKRATVLRRLERRLQVRGLADLSAYHQYLETHPEETKALLQDMLISVTNFFRNRECFDALEREALPELLNGRPDNEPIRAWVAGCATGEEAYSISILLREYLDSLKSSVGIQIFATDIDEQAIQVARNGVYPAAIMVDVSPARLQNYFFRENDTYRILGNCREPMLFAVHNVLRDPPFARLDIICCRNLLIYLDREAQRSVLETFHFALKVGGYLFLGNSETEDAAPGLFTIVDKKNRIYRANPRPHALRYLPSVSVSTIENHSKLIAGVETERRRLSFAQVHQRALEHCALPSILIDRDYRILHSSPTVTRFLEHSAGEPSHNLLSNIHPELRLELRAALFRASRSEASFDTDPIRLSNGGQPLTVIVSIRHYRDTNLEQDFLLIIFKEIGGDTALESSNVATSGTELVVSQLESQIKRYKAELQDTIERSDISTEELKAANEELQAVNEELRSATEELETSKEELQSMNEELVTLNYELKLKIDEADANNDYLHNLIASTGIATIFIDRDMRIVRFTPRASDIFHLLPADCGRPLMDIRHRLDYKELSDDIHSTIRDLRGSERKVRAESGQFYLARSLPYRTKDNKVEGAVLTFVDITELHAAEERVLSSERQLWLAAETTKDYIIITLDQGGHITAWNAGAERAFGYTEAEIVGALYETIFTEEDRLELAHQQELQRARTTGKSDDERWHRRKNGTTFYCSGVLTRIDDSNLYGFVKIARDLTGSKRLELEREAQLMGEKEERLRMKLASETKDEFLAVMSHELKNPLNLIHVNAELLSHLPEVQQSPAVARATDIIRRTVLTQAKIIDDLLDLSRARTGKLTLNRNPASVDEIVQSIVVAAESQAKTKNISIEFTCGSEPLISFCDAVRVEQIVWNLLSNAIKFTPSDGTIFINLEREDDMVKLTVRDSGEGIAPDALATVFEMFNQGSRTANSRDTGMGIGLALVKELTEAHGGAVAAESPGLQQGSTFTVRLPLCIADQQFHSLSKSADNVLQGLRILVVDDSPEGLEPLAQLLRLLGAEVYAALSGREALELMETVDLDLLISDIGMPEMDGYELMEAVRAQARWSELHAIALTGYGRPQDEIRARQAGFNAHLSKPTSLEDLKRIAAKLRI